MANTLTVCCVWNGPNALPGSNRASPVRLPGAPLHNHWRTYGGLPWRYRFVCSTTFKEKEPITHPVTQGVQPEPFDWNKCWYPVAILADLEPKRPIPLKLLGRDFVLWRDVSEEWRCFEDACPHRLAPLSEGRIEPSDGSLMCSYHGWRFQSDGECTRIPQAKDGGASGGCKNPRSKAKAYPVKVERGMVWVWPDESPSAFIDSAAKELEEISADKEDRYRTRLPYMKEQPISFDILIENALDPSHLPFVHHGEIVSRETVRGEEGRKCENARDDEMRFIFTSHTAIMGAANKTRAKKSTLTFHPPHLVTQSADYPGFSIAFYVTPVTSTTCRTFFLSSLPKKPSSLLARFLRVVLFRNWFFHLLQNRVVDGDQVVLSRQEKNLRQRTKLGKGWESQYFLPASCDIALVTFRRWLEGSIGGGGPKLPNGEPLLQNEFDERTRTSLLDRYNSHTKHCRICVNALRNFRVLKSLSQLVCASCAAYCLVLAQSVISGSGVCLWKCFCSIAGAILSALLSRKIGQIEQSYMYTGFNHWKT